ncbi:MAG TPA: hypothetical protein DDY59_00315 [Lachnospiraceae bacterium]|nr:hypothetical protein [Lachnospiraceae bacterium]
MKVIEATPSVKRLHYMDNKHAIITKSLLLFILILAKSTKKVKKSIIKRRKTKCKRLTMKINNETIFIIKEKRRWTNGLFRT